MVYHDRHTHFQDSLVEEVQLEVKCTLLVVLLLLVLLVLVVPVLAVLGFPVLLVVFTVLLVLAVLGFPVLLVVLAVFPMLLVLVGLGLVDRLRSFGRSDGLGDSRGRGDLQNKRN